MSEIIHKIKTVRWQQFLIVVLIAAVVAGSEGCKTSGKISKKERKAQIETAKKQLQEIINGTTTLPLDQQDKLISDIAGKNYNDKELNQLIIEATQKVKKAYADQERIRQQKIDAARASLLDMMVNKENKSADELQKEVDAIKAQNLNDPEITELIDRVEKKIETMRATGSSDNIPLKSQLESAFQSIVDASKSGNTTQVNAIIARTLKLFSSDDAPVLIIISREGNIVDYDKPTTIKRYLNFLGDQKVNRDAIDSYQMDSGGKIKELDLIKKQW